MAKRLFCLLIAACMLLQLLPPTGVHAAEAVPSDSGVCGTDAAYTFSGGTLTVTGTGEIMDSAFRSMTGITRVVIESGITGIGKQAFRGCTGMTDISLPDTLTHIRERALADTGLTSLTLPAGLLEIHDYFLENTPGVKELTIPASVSKMCQSTRVGALYGSCVETLNFESGMTAIPEGAARGASALRTVIIPDTVKLIGRNAFRDCLQLRAVIMGKSVEEISGSVFWGCTSLTSITLPESLKIIRACAFADTALTELALPDGLQELGGSMLAGNTGVKELTIPSSTQYMYDSANKNCLTDSAVETVTFADGMKRIPSSALMGAYSVKTVHIPDSVTTVGDFAFVNTSMELVVLPDSVTTLEMNAFYSTAQAITVVVPDSVSVFGKQCFAGSPNLTVLCGMDSPMARYAIENGVALRFNNSLTDSPDRVLDLSASSLTADADGANINGQITLTLRYALKEDLCNRVRDMRLLVRLPKGSTLLQETLQLDGTLCTRYDYQEDTLSVPVTAFSGGLKFSVQTRGVDSLSAYAGLSMLHDGESAFEMIGTMQRSFRLVSIDVPDVVTETRFPLSGYAPAGETVTVSVDGVKQGSATANKAGSWQLTAELPNPTPMRPSTITATCGSLSQTCTVIYNPAEPVLTGFTMTFNGGKDSIDLLANYYPYAYFVPGTEFVFHVAFDHSESIQHVTVVSNRDNQHKYLEAVYDEASGAFVTQGYFDPDDPNYVPGTLHIEYNKHRSNALVGGQVDWEEMKLSQAENAVTVHKNTSHDYEATVSLASIAEGLAEIGIRTVISCYDANAGASLSDWMGLSKDADTLLSYTVEGHNGEKYLLTLDYSDPYTYVMIIHDVTSNTYVKMILESAIDGVEPGATANAMKLGQAAQVISDSSTVISMIYEQYQIQQEMDELRKEIYARDDLDPDERKEALRRVDELENGKKMFSLTMAVIPMIVTAPIAVGATMSAAPLILFTGLLAVISLSSDFFWDASIARIRGEEFRVRWVIDPSGYVYDNETGELLPGVTTTAYHIPYDGSETFWNMPPAANVYGEKWDASEYDQSNPLKTNADGKYAWDVPEGWWRVKYEMPGYETVWSDWLPVPPPQTEVNIGMTPTDEPHEHTFGLWVIDTESVLGGAAGTKHRSCECGETEQASYTNPLTDVPNGKYYSKPIFWAYENGITKGKTATEFQRDMACTRKQIVTFLWRAAGCPDPESMENPFDDVTRGDQFEKAILWAYYAGITKGTSDTQFSPEKPCTRKQIVMFLWRFSGNPEPASMVNPFDDVKRGDQFEKAILWAYCRGITTGKTKTQFQPEEPCTRGQIVTFLWRAMA